jgi:hypothetical protein
MMVHFHLILQILIVLLSSLVILLDDSTCYYLEVDSAAGVFSHILSFSKWQKEISGSICFMVLHFNSLFWLFLVGGREEVLDFELRASGLLGRLSTS